MLVRSRIKGNFSTKMYLITANTHSDHGPVHFLPQQQFTFLATSHSSTSHFIFSSFYTYFFFISNCFTTHYFNAQFSLLPTTVNFSLLLHTSTNYSAHFTCTLNVYELLCTSHLYSALLSTSMH